MRARIYLITNLINGKVYIGKSNDPQRRWIDHKKVALGGKEKYPKDFFAIHAAICKYSVDNFKIEILKEFDNEEDAYKAETDYILFFRSNLSEFGYNCNLGGEGGITPNDDVRKKLIVAQNKPEKLKLLSDLMKERHLKNPRFLGKLQAKLTEKQVKEIREKYKPGVYGFIKLAKEYNVKSTSTIRKIITGKTWRHI